MGVAATLLELNEWTLHMLYLQGPHKDRAFQAFRIFDEQN